MEFADGKILAEIKDGVGRITFNQPEKRNAMSRVVVKLNKRSVQW